MDNITNLRQSVSEFAKSLDLPPFVHELNELLNQHMWEQAAAEEKRAMQKIADVWAIVQAVANERSTYCDERSWVVAFECPFCNSTNDKEQPDHVTHEPDCIVTKARALAKATEQGE